MAAASSQDAGDDGSDEDVDDNLKTPTGMMCWIKSVCLIL